ncbi:hypothetical protein, partial [Rhodoblastus acidophilus]|uniref:hypothetical protein n=1 Tax=Rhodoblastus acidophilus TaxID=1074 RepID=UPI001AED4B25
SPVESNKSRFGNPPPSQSLGDLVLLLTIAAGCEQKKEAQQPQAPKLTQVEDTGAWSYNERTDPMTGARTVFAYTKTNNSEKLIFS